MALSERDWSDVFGKAEIVASGDTLDEETYEKAKPYFFMTVAAFHNLLPDIHEIVRRLVCALREKYDFTREAVERMAPYIVRFTQDVHSGKIDLKQAVTEQSKSLINQVAMRWLQEARESRAPHCLHVLVLARWGLEQNVHMECPEKDRPELDLQVGHLLRWKPADVLEWLIDNPNGPSGLEQAQNLLQALEGAESPESAAALVLNTIYSRQRAENPTLQPAGDPK